MQRSFTPFIAALFLLYTIPLLSQKPASVNNIQMQPLWGPVDYTFVEYYYIPSCEIYYHVPTAQFIYKEGSDWLYSEKLPQSACDLFNAHKVVINEARPYYRHRNFELKYKDLATASEHQTTIGESNDPKYFIVEGHPQYKEVAIKDEKAKKIPAKKKER